MSTLVLQRAMSILDVFNCNERSATLSVIAAQTGLPKPTAYRLTMALVDAGFLCRADPGFRLAEKLYALGQRVPTYLEISRAARSHLESLYEKVHESVTLQTMNDNATIIYLERVRTSQCHNSPRQLIPEDTPHATSGGKVLLAYGDRDRLERYLSKSLARLTRYSITDPARLRIELRRIRRQGYGVAVEETRLGDFSVAVPVLGPGNALIGAVAVSSMTMTMLRVSPLLEAMRETSALISRDLTEMKVVALSKPAGISLPGTKAPVTADIADVSVAICLSDPS
jgi:DNA-binding IclR family transcriptional regulator